MRVILVPDDATGNSDVLKDSITDATRVAWDVVEWSDNTLVKDSDARGLFARMIAQSVQEWAEKAAMEAKHKASRLQRDAAKEEVETELARQKEEDDVGF